LILRDGDFVGVFAPVKTCPHSPLFICEVGGSPLVLIKTLVFWGMTSYWWVICCWHFGGVTCRSLQCSPRRLPFRWRQQGPLKCGHKITIQHYVTPENCKPYCCT